MIYSLSMHQLLAQCQGKLEPGREGRARCQGAETRPALLRRSVAVPSRLRWTWLGRRQVLSRLRTTSWRVGEGMSCPGPSHWPHPSPFGYEVVSHFQENRAPKCRHLGSSSCFRSSCLVVEHPQFASSAHPASKLQGPHSPFLPSSILCSLTWASTWGVGVKESPHPHPVKWSLAVCGATCHWHFHPHSHSPPVFSPSETQAVAPPTPPTPMRSFLMQRPSTCVL